eukprot:TRINITY_DN2144_c0_g1_i3.p1 TRINITY_DN2144_c0_g1~~TRINITY_DN2144_c0_g1_i3.p1  ORF type:complete len:451 (-),score=40.27 TRINITY_DN2144_c0_g1_i3:82-1434(-)
MTSNDALGAAPSSSPVAIVPGSLPSTVADLEGQKAKLPQKRFCVLDNAKFILSICVAMEHLGPCFLCKPTESFEAVWASGITMFMMPTWTFISGYCSSTDLSNVRKVDGCIKVIAIYLLSQLFWVLISRYAHGWYSTTPFGRDDLGSAGARFRKSSWKVEDWLFPYWQLWYLMDLAVWRLVLPFWARLKYPLISAWLLSSIVDSFYLYSGIFEHGRLNSLTSIWMYFPLYYLGVVAKTQEWEVRHGIWYRLAGMLVFVVCVGFRPHFEPADMTLLWRFAGHSHTIVALTGSNMFGQVLQCGIRLLSYIIIACVICAFFHVVPREKVPLMTSLGGRSLANYIFHPLSGLLLSYIGIYGDGHSGTPDWGRPVRIVLTILTSMFWMSPWVWKVVWPICDPPIHLILKPQTNDVEARQKKQLPGCLARLKDIFSSTCHCFYCAKKQDLTEMSAP